MLIIKSVHIQERIRFSGQIQLNENTEEIQRVCSKKRKGTEDQCLNCLQLERHYLNSHVGGRKGYCFMLRPKVMIELKGKYRGWQASKGALNQLEQF